METEKPRSAPTLCLSGWAPQRIEEGTCSCPRIKRVVWGPEEAALEIDGLAEVVVVNKGLDHEVAEVLYVGAFFWSPISDRPSLQYKQVTRIRITPQIAGSLGSEFSRRRQRKISIPKTKVAAPKGFAPRPQVVTGTQKKIQTDSEEKEGSETAGPSDYTLSSSEFNEIKSFGDEEKTRFGSQSGILLEMLDEVDDQGYGNENTDGLNDDEVDGQRSEDDGDGIGLGKHLTNFCSNEKVVKGKVSNIGDGLKGVESGTSVEDVAGKAHKDEVNSGSSLQNSPVKAETDVLEEVERKNVYIEEQIGKTVLLGKRSSVSVSAQEVRTTPVRSDVGISKELDKRDKYLVNEEPEMELMAKHKADTDAQTNKQIVENLAQANFLSGNKIFIFPEEVKPEQVIEVFLNRSLTVLMSENDVLIKGAFNGWRWESFTEKMHKTDLEGDWWSCKLYVPREAYQIDFVFFNGGNIYENNNYRDFSVPVGGIMDKLSFEELLLEEKRKELEILAAEQAERERQAEEQHRREAEEAAREAERSQARAEVDKKKEAFRQVMKLAQSSGGIWHIEPSVFKGGDKVKLYYDRSSRPLENAAEVWIHGDHNNWTDGLAIVERLVASKKKDGDWWCVDGKLLRV